MNPSAHTVPPAALANALSSELGCGTHELRLTPLSGGCINHAFRVDGPGDRIGFLKWRRSAGEAVFEAEADGLAALRRIPGLRIPDVWAWHDSGPYSWLLMEFVPAARPTPEYWERLGAGIAALHSAGPGPELETGLSGWPRDNWIGSLPQSNGPMEDWAEFFTERRLRPQLRMALGNGRLADGALWDDFLVVAGQLLRQVAEPVSQLHGDLWNGNVYSDTDAQPVVIDPAVYVGHSEVDLAMADLFGGFPSDFHRAYRERMPVPAEYERTRRPLYQAYPVLVHVNLFGGGYAAHAEEVARRVISAGR